VCSLSVRALRLPEATTALLGELGLFEIGQVLALPRKSLTSRLGSQLIDRLDQLLGDANEVLVTHHAPVEFEAQWT
jgi:protein ImuB